MLIPQVIQWNMFTYTWTDDPIQRILLNWVGSTTTYTICVDPLSHFGVRHLHAKPKNSKHRNLQQVFTTRESKSQNTQLSPSIFWWKFKDTPLFDVFFPGRGFRGTSGWVPWKKDPMMHLCTVRYFFLFLLFHRFFLHGWTKASLKQRQCFCFLRRNGSEQNKPYFAWSTSWKKNVYRKLARRLRRRLRPCAPWN